jgi:hypothetical protein
MRNYKKVIYFLLIMSLIMTMMGGYCDMTNTDKIWIVSKEHFWNDGLYLLVLTVLIAIYCK